MEFILLGLMILAFPFIAIVALVKAVGHTDRLLRLETRLAAIEARLGGAAVLKGAPGAAPPKAEPPIPTAAAEPVAHAQAAVPEPPKVEEKRPRPFHRLPRPRRTSM